MSAAPRPGAVPGADTQWTVEGNRTLTPTTPVTLAFTNDKGLTFKRTISVDDNYMFKLSDSVLNSGTAPVSLSNYGRVTRFDKPTHASIYVLHEGLIGVTGEEGLEEIKYSKVEDEKQVKPGKSTDGWLGITDKYWAVTLVPSEKQPFQPRYAYFDDGRPRYQSDFLSDPISVAPGQTVAVETLVFAGAKEVGKIQAYETDDKIRQFDLLIDWGWFYFITKPMFWLIDTLYKVLGNFGLAILATTVIVKAIFFPLANKSYKSMAKMKMVQPKMLEIREKYADDKMKQQQAMMELYKTEKINPLAGCWPVVIQIPGLLRALQGALRHHRDAPCAVLRLDSGSGGARSDIGVQPVRPDPDHPAAYADGRRLADHHGHHDVPADAHEPDAAGPDAADDLHLDAGDLHLHAGHLPGRSGDLLGLEQHAVDHPAGRHHEAPGRQDRAVGQSGRPVQEETVAGRIGRPRFVRLTSNRRPACVCAETIFPLAA